MANAFAVVLSYIDNILWLCTRVVYSIIFIFEFNYRLVAAIFRGCMQLWTLTIQGTISMGEAIVSTIEFFGNLPFFTYKFVCYLLDISTRAVTSGIQLSVAWCVTNALWCCQAIATGMWNIVAQFSYLFSMLFESLLAGTDHVTSVFYSLLECSMKYTKDTGVFLKTAKDSLLVTLFDIVDVTITNIIVMINYPIELTKDTCYHLLEFSRCVMIGTVSYFNSFITVIVDAYNDALSLLAHITLYPVRVYCGMVDVVEEGMYEVYKSYLSVSDRAQESLSSIMEFVINNWYAIIALSLCFTFLAAITFYLNVQHDRNVENTLQNLTRLITSLTQSHAARGQGMEQRGGQHHDEVPPEDQAPAEARGDNPPEDRNVQFHDVMNQHQVQDGGDQPGPSQDRAAGHHRPSYSLRSRPFTPTDEEGSGKNSVEGIMKDLKNRLNEEYDKQLCVVCMTTAKDTLFLPCRHLCVCLACAEVIIENQNRGQRQCPLCRSRIGSIVEVYS